MNSATSRKISGNKFEFGCTESTLDPEADPKWRLNEDVRRLVDRVRMRDRERKAYGKRFSIAIAAHVICIRFNYPADEANRGQICDPVNADTYT